MQTKPLANVRHMPCKDSCKLICLVQASFTGDSGLFCRRYRALVQERRYTALFREMYSYGSFTIGIGLFTRAIRVFHDRYRALLVEIQGLFPGDVGLFYGRCRALLREMQGSFAGDAWHTLQSYIDVSYIIYVYVCIHVPAWWHCLYICIYIYMYIHIYIYIYIYMCVYTHRRICIYTYLYIYIDIYVCTYHNIANLRPTSEVALFAMIDKVCV